MNKRKKLGRKNVYKVKLLPCMCYVAPSDKKKLKSFEDSLKLKHLVKESEKY